MNFPEDFSCGNLDVNWELAPFPNSSVRHKHWIYTVYIARRRALRPLKQGTQSTPSLKTQPFEGPSLKSQNMSGRDIFGEPPTTNHWRRNRRNKYTHIIIADAEEIKKATAERQLRRLYVVL